MGIEMKYFVLKPKGKDAFAAASRKAMRAYARHIEMIDPDLSESLYVWSRSESIAVLEEDYE